MNVVRPPETTGAWRVLRGAVVSSAATGLALAGHVAGGGQAPPLPALTAVALGVGAVGVGLSRFSWTLPRLLALLLVSQPLLHVVFGWAHTTSGAGMHHRGHAMATGSIADGMTTAWPMLAAHVAAALGTALLLSRGEQWLAGVLDAVGLRAVRLLRVTVCGYAFRPQPIPIRAHHLPRQRVAADAWWQRGPPW